MPTRRISKLKHQATDLLPRIQRDRKTLEQHADILKGIALGEQAVIEGRTLTHAEAIARMRRWLK